MHVIGLTGGIGSGKSTIAKLFSAFGIEWVDLDDVARKIVEPNRPELQIIFDHFSPNISNIKTPQGELNRGALRDYVFSQPSEKQWLESLLHPAITAQAKQELSKTKSRYSLLISPLLFEKNTTVEKSIVIDVDEDTQVARASLRDGNSKEQIIKIMATQLSRTERNNRADFIINNSGSLKSTQLQVENIHFSLLNYYQ